MTPVKLPPNSIPLTFTRTHAAPSLPQLRDALAKNMVRVIDLFREWDDDASGAVSRKEFRKAMQELGCEIERKHIDALFDEWDPDKSGSLQIAELNKQLRQAVELDPSLLPGAAGEIELTRDQNYAVRTAKVDKANSMLLQGFDIDEASDKPVSMQARPSNAFWRAPLTPSAAMAFDKGAGCSVACYPYCASCYRSAPRCPESTSPAPCVRAAARRARQEHGARDRPLPRVGRRQLGHRLQGRVPACDGGARAAGTGGGGR